MKCNLSPSKVSAILTMQEQMVETKAWKKNRQLEQDDMCRLCGKSKEGVIHLLSGCTVLAGTEYVSRHNDALKILTVAWAKERGLLSNDTIWYKIKLKAGDTWEQHDAKMIWDFEYALRKETSARRPDLTLEEKDTKRILLIDLACPSEYNVNEKNREKLTKYQQLAYEIRERRPVYKVEIIPLVIGCVGGGAERLKAQLEKVLINKDTVNYVCKEMVKEVVWHSETILRKVLSGVVQAI